MSAHLWSGVLVGLFLSMPLLAKEVNLAVTLSHLSPVQTTEKRGDELYISVTEYNSSISPVNYRVPEFPLYWRPQGPKSARDVLLWANSFKEGEGASVIFSLIEQDMAPWDLDDLIGTIKLKVRNEKGKLKSEWVIPHQAGHQVILKPKNTFILKGNQGEYGITLKLEEKKVASNFIQQRTNIVQPNPFAGL